MLAIGYARVSTMDQSVDLQLDALKEAGCRRIFEEARSGADRERPKLNEALEFLQPGDTLVVWKWDRLARSLSHLIEIVELLHARGCGLRSLTEAIDTTTAGGRLVFHVFGALAEFERDINRERTLAGLASARARGRKGGRPRVLTGQKLDVAHALLRDGSLTVREVAKQIQVSEATLYKHIPAPRSLLLSPQLAENRT
jgi:DNA invertase Pin-like site-specific DNA recombinase